MTIIINTQSGQYTVHSVAEATNIIQEVVQDTEKAHSLAESIYAVANSRPDGAPALIINLAKEEDNG